MTARDFRFGIVSVEIYVGENTTISVPAANLRFRITQHELFTAGTTFFDYQSRVWLVGLPYGRKTQAGGNASAGKLRLRTLRSGVTAVLALLAAGRLVITTRIGM